MERIKSLFATFSRYEIKIFKAYLGAFHNKGENKSLQLITLIEKKPGITADQASSKLYSDSKSKAFLMLKARLFERMTEFLSLSISNQSESEHREDPLDATTITIRKKMLSAALMKERGLRVLAREFLNEALELTRRYALPELEVDALLRLKALQTNSALPYYNEDIWPELSNALGRLGSDLNAIAVYHRYLQIHARTNNSEQESIEYLERNLPQLEPTVDANPSPKAKFYLLSMKINYYALKNLTDLYRDAIQSQLKLVTSELGLRSAGRISKPYYFLGILELHSENYAACIEAFNRFLDYTPPEVQIHSLSLTMKCAAHIYLNQLDEAEAICKRLIKVKENPPADYRPKQIEKGEYLLGCIEYIRGNTRKAWQLLQGLNELTTDKTGWNVGIRIFEIMLLIDLEDADTAQLRLESLRKHISRYSPGTRAETIFKILSGIEKNSFNPGPVKNEEALLEVLEKETDWNREGPEVIRFEHWYEKWKRE